MYRKAIFQKAFRQVGVVLAGDSPKSALGMTVVRSRYRPWPFADTRPIWLQDRVVY